MLPATEHSNWLLQFTDYWATCYDKIVCLFCPFYTEFRNFFLEYLIALSDEDVSFQEATGSVEKSVKSVIALSNTILLTCTTKLCIAAKPRVPCATWPTVKNKPSKNTCWQSISLSGMDSPPWAWIRWANCPRASLCCVVASWTGTLGRAWMLALVQGHCGHTSVVCLFADAWIVTPICCTKKQ